MKAKVFTNVPGITAAFDGRRVVVSAREDESVCVSLERRDGGWVVLSQDGSRLGDLSSLDEAAVRDAGLRPWIARLMRGAAEAVKQVSGELPPVNAGRWEYAELRVKDPTAADPAEELPLDALNEAGADGWELVDVYRMAGGRLVRALFKRFSAA